MRVREGGYRRLLLITPAQLFDDLSELPGIIHNPSVRRCDYWGELVAELDDRQPDPIVVGEGAAKMRVYDLPL
jgi:hypothetical protein